jgi:hypothetical protein
MKTWRFFLQSVVSVIFTSVFLLALLISIPVQASEEGTLNEDDLFSDSDTIVDAEEMTEESIASEADKPGFSISGLLYNTNLYSTRRDEYILKNPDIEDDDIYIGDLTANVLLEARYKWGIKAFANTEMIYSYGDFDDFDQFLREVFFDFNINRAVYVRIGKQYLKWGRNFFWNPSDLINVEKQDFLDPDKNLEGTRGVKIHIPFGTKYNIYAFANLEEVGLLEDVAWSGKFEFLVGDTEMAFSGWYKKGFEPVFSYDFSTRLFRMDIQGEISISHGENQDSLLRVIDDVGNASYTTTRIEDKWIPKASISFIKTYDLFDINDRISIRGEFYYNHVGYSYNVFEDQQSLLTLLGSGLYEPNHVSKYYAALFTGIRRFIVTDASLNINVISNLTDGSSIIYSSFTYNPWYDFFINLIASFAVGDGRDEYTFAGSDKTFGLEFICRF